MQLAIGAVLLVRDRSLAHKHVTQGLVLITLSKVLKGLSGKKILKHRDLAQSIRVAHALANVHHHLHQHSSRHTYSRRRRAFL
jgi:hypothetical protein